MIQPSRSARVALAVVGVAGAVALAGCAPSEAQSDAEATTSSSSSSSAPSSSSSGADTSGATAGEYANGTYTASGSYQTPESVEEVEVTITLDNDVITAVEVVGDPTRRESEEYQSRFIGGIENEVVGKNIDEISVSRVAGSSLTSAGFNEAIEQIRADAAV